jgi:imidazolonepropionase-like amidohydrolase
MLRVRDSINAGLIPGPRVLAAGVWVGVKGGVCEFNGIGLPADSGAFRQRIRNNVAAGADVIKLCLTGWPADAFTHPEQVELSDDLLSASVDQAHKLGRRVIAHDLSRAGVIAALRAGVDGLAHAAYVDSALASQMREAGVFLIPTLASLTGRDTSDASRALVRAVAVTHRAGVRIVFGTDAGAVPHGRGGEEFAALLRAGFTPLEAIRAATLDAALAFGLADSVGTIRNGKSADVIAVDDDPLQNIDALRAPRFVMVRGKPAS